jgi:YegS/Rv2252/BmrU family lipid kinase
VAVGGDGTVHEVARGLIEQGGRVPLGVIPMGTGNDFVKAIGMPGAPDAAVAALQRALPRAVDHGWVRWDEQGTMQEQAFVNAVGIGFDARVAHEASTFKRLPGMTAYLAAVFRTLRKWTSPPARVTAETPAGEAVCLYDGPLLLTTVGNGVSSGGAFYLTPQASIRDGVLDACIVAHASPWRIVQVLPRALRGRHTAEPEVHMATVRRLRLQAEAPLPLHADGEGLSRGTRTLEVRIAEGGLRVLMSPESAAASPGLRENRD